MKIRIATCTKSCGNYPVSYREMDIPTSDQKAPLPLDKFNSKRLSCTISTSMFTRLPSFMRNKTLSIQNIHSPLYRFSLKLYFPSSRTSFYSDSCRSTIQCILFSLILTTDNTSFSYIFSWTVSYHVK